MSKLASIDTKKEVIERLAAGQNSIEISDMMDIPSSTIREFRRRNREEIEKRAAELIEVLPDIIDDAKQKIRLNRKLTNYIENPEKNSNDTALQKIPDILQFQYQVSKIQDNVLKSVGILPSQSPSFIFNQINQDNSKSVVVETQVLDLIQKSTENMLGLPKLDVPDEEIKDIST